MELGRGSAEMEPIRTDNKSDEVDGGDGTSAPGSGRIGVPSTDMGRAQQGPCPGKRMRRPWTAHRHKAAVSSWWSEKLAWDTGQAGITQNRLGDCCLKPQIFYMAFSGPSTATSSCSPIQKTLKKMLVFFHMCPCLASPGCPGHCPLWHSPATLTQPLGLIIKVTPPGAPCPSEGLGLLQGFVYTLNVGNSLDCSVHHSGNRDDT